MFPTRRFPSLRRIADIDEASSGREVPMAARVRPIINSESPKYLAISTDPFIKKSEPNHTYTIGLLWFVVLLANKRQGEAEIFQHLKSLLESDGENNSPLGKADDVFQPYQLFWSSKDENVNTSHWNEQWDKILGIGQELLLAGYHNDYKEKADIFELLCQYNIH